MRYLQWIFVICVAILVNSVYPYNDDEVNYHESWKYLPVHACGRGKFTDRIIGGQRAHIGQFPWMVRIGYARNQRVYRFDCGGVLLNHRYVLTAAHCGSTYKHVIRAVHLGENSLLSRVDCQNGVCAPTVQHIPVIQEYIHRGFHPELLTNDIALLKLAHRAQFNEFVQPICLPHKTTLKKSYSNAGAVGFAKVAGWGQTNPFSEIYTYPYLMYVSKPILPLEFCREFYLMKPLGEGQICAGEGNGYDSCIGDSGGPLMRPMVQPESKTKIPKYTAIGIVSYGKAICGTAPAVYTKISYYMKWILDHISTN